MDYILKRTASNVPMAIMYCVFTGINKICILKLLCSVL